MLGPVQAVSRLHGLSTCHPTDIRFAIRWPIERTGEKEETRCLSADANPQPPLTADKITKISLLKRVFCKAAEVYAATGESCLRELASPPLRRRRSNADHLCALPSTLRAVAMAGHTAVAVHADALLGGSDLVVPNTMVSAVDTHTCQSRVLVSSSPWGSSSCVYLSLSL